MDPVEIVLRLIGAFYAFAGYVGSRAMLTSHFLDYAIAAIAAKKPDPVETSRTTWLLCASSLILAGGLLLMLLLDWAVWLFLISAIAQAVYLFYAAPNYFDLADPPDGTGRQQSTNAFVLFSAATAFVVWAAYAGKLVTWREVPWPTLAVAGAAMIAHVVYIGHSLSKSPKPKGLAAFAGSEDDGAETERARAKSKRVKVMAEFYAYPLWALDDDLDGDFPPDLLGLSPDLVSDLAAWSEAYMAAKDPDKAFTVVWSDEERRAHEAEGRKLAVRLARECPDRVVFAFEQETGVVQVHPDEAI